MHDHPAGFRRMGQGRVSSAICMIVRNERRDIAEWIAYHGLLGFDAQIIFDHCSDDGTGVILAQAARCYDIRIHNWTDHSKQSQVHAYDAALAAYGREFDWICFLDSDEFLVLPDEQRVNQFLAAHDDYAGIALPWAIYGAGGHDDYPPGLVIESFQHRAASDFFPARHVKSLVRPVLARRCLNPHCFDLAGGRAGSYCLPGGAPAQWLPAPEHGGILPGFLAFPPDYGGARVNHYFTRSRAHWLAKLRRGYPSDVAVRRMEEFADYDRNEVHDPVLLPWAGAVRQGVARIMRPL